MSDKDKAAELVMAVSQLSVDANKIIPLALELLNDARAEMPTETRSETSGVIAEVEAVCQGGLGRYTPAREELFHEGELASAAAAYILPERYYDEVLGRPEIFPWYKAFWKPKDRRTNLICAAALIVAEIERLDRARESNV